MLSFRPNGSVVIHCATLKLCAMRGACMVVWVLNKLDSIVSAITTAAWYTPHPIEKIVKETVFIHRTEPNWLVFVNTRTEFWD
jgi:hypothetical protein